MRTALGLSTHTGWTAVVAIAREPEPQVLAKRRVQVAWTFEEGAVYHNAEGLSPAKATIAIDAAKKKFEGIATEQFGELLGELKKGGHRIHGAALIAGSTKPLPAIESILKSHALVHTAEGAMYREIFAAALAGWDVKRHWIGAKELRARACAALGASEAELDQLLVRLGKASGRPWTRDQKDATLAALSIL